MASDVTITFDFESTKKSRKKVEKDAKKVGKKAGKKAGKNFSEGFSDSLKSLGKQIAAAAAVAVTALAFKKLVSSSIKAAATVETLSVKFETFLGSAAAAEAQVRSLVEFAASTPFRLEGLAAASTQLLAFGFSQKDSIDKLIQLGDVAAGAGEPIKDIARIFGQVSAASKLTGERLNQLQEKGIPIGAALAKAMKRPESAIRDLVSKGKVSFKIFEKAFDSLSDKGGKFAGGMERLSRTVNGLLSTLADNTFAAFAKAGKAFEPLTKFLIKDSIKSIQDFSNNGLNVVVKGVNELVLRLIDLRVILVDVQIVLIGLKERFLDFYNSVDAESFGFFETLKSGFLKAKEFFLSISDRIKEAADKTATSVSAAGKKQIENLQKSKELFFKLQEDLRASVSKTIEKGKELATAGTGAKVLTDLEKNLQALLDKIQQFGVTKLSLLEDQRDKDIKVLNESREKDIIGAVAHAAAKLAIEKKFNDDKAALTKKGATTAEKLNKAFSAKLASGVSKGIALLATNLAEGKSLFDNFGNFLLTTLGDMAQQIGAMMIATGIGLLNLFSGNPVGLIAAGAGLIAIGAVLSSFGGSDGGALETPSGGGVAAYNEVENTSIDEIVDEPVELEKRKTDTVVNLTIQGDVLDSDSSSLKIVDLLNSAFDKQGVALSSNARFA